MSSRDGKRADFYLSSLPLSGTSEGPGTRAWGGAGKGGQVPRGRRARTRLGQHGRQELAHDGAPLPHLALLAVGEVGNDADDVPGAGGLQGVGHDQQLHHGRVHISATVGGRV